MKNTKAPEGFKRWEIKITLDVSDNWVADGFDMSDKGRIEELEEAIQGMLPFAYYKQEVKTDIEILATPTKKEIGKLQGF